MGPARWIEEPCRSALNRVEGMDFRWTLNPYGGCAHRCTYCYVRGYEARADRPAGDAYGRTVRVKVNVADVLPRELASRSWRRELVVVGAATDPYQPAEGTWRLTRRCLEALGQARTPVGLITRGPLMVRDIDVLATLAVGAGVEVSVSVPTLDPDIWRSTEPATAPPHQRMRAVRRLADAGIKVAVAIAPVLPGLTDSPRRLADVVAAARDAGAVKVWAALLHLRPGVREHFLECLAKDWPALLPRYERLYRGAWAPRPVAEAAKDEVRRLAARFDVGDHRALRLEPAPVPEQLELAALTGAPAPR